jgi:hypothetical protein
MELPYCALSLVQVPDRVTVLYRPGPFLVQEPDGVTVLCSFFDPGA